MFDEQARRFKDVLLTPLARGIKFLTPSQLSLIGLIMALIMFVLLIRQEYMLAFVFWMLNRFFDGLDGLVAREYELQSDFGGYVDIICDFIAYMLVPIGLVLGQPTTIRWIALVLLLGTFYVNSASWMYLSAILEKRNTGALSRGEQTTISMPVGLVAGFETIVFFSVFIAAPKYVEYLFGLMAVMVVIGIVQRLVWANRNIRN